MKRSFHLIILVAALAVAALATACGGAAVAPAPVPSYQFDEGFIKLSEVSEGDRSVPIYLTIKNAGSAPGQLLSLQYNVAKAVELRKGNDKVATIDIPANDKVVMTPATYHAQIIGLPPMKVGDTFNIGLFLSPNTTTSFPVVVRP